MSRIAAPVRFVGFLVLALAPWKPIAAQNPDPAASSVEGYVTSVRSATEFDVKRHHIVTTGSTQIGSYRDSGDDQGKAPAQIELGMYVQVAGTINWAEHTLVAAVVRVRDDADRKVSGSGVIVRVLTPGAEPVFRADGYNVRIGSGTETNFNNGLSALSDVGVNTWVRFGGRLNDSGEVIAARADFAKPKPPKVKKNRPIEVQQTVIPHGSLIDFDGTLKTDMTKRHLEDAGGACGTGWYPVPPDRALQDRVRRVGMSVVPQYQRDMAADDLEKIPFRFYAIDEKWIHSDMFCYEGAVLVPMQMVERLANDDQLAAVLADGVAANLQRQRARLLSDMGWIGATEAAVYLTARNAASSNSAWVGGMIVNHEIEVRLEHERGRVSLGLMADAGYDPWQAPEAWKLIEPGHLPKNISKLKYSARSLYLLSILQQQQFKHPETAASSAGQAGDAAAVQKAN